MQILDGGIAYISEGCNKPLIRRPVLVESQRVAVTVEGSTEGCCFTPSHVFAGCNVSLETGLHQVLVPGVFNHRLERFPVVGITNSDISFILTGGIAVDDIQ